MIFIWSGETRSGISKKGELDVKNKDLAIATLRKKGIINVSIKKKGFEIKISTDKVQEKDIAVFFRQLSTMIDAGVPIVQCFELAEKGCTNEALLKLLSSIRISMEGGMSFTESLRLHPKDFDKLSIAMIDAGELGGILDVILLRLCVYKEKSLALKAKVKSAMIYPAAILIVSFCITAILMIFVIPVFADMFSGFGADLPYPTQIAMMISDFFVEFWYLVVGVPIAGFYAIKYFYGTDSGEYILDNFLLKLPIIGPIIKKSAVAKFSRTFSTLSASGVPILDSLDTVAMTSGNRVVEEAILKCKDSLTIGEGLVEPLEECGLFPLMVTQMISIGEQTGALEVMLGKIADFYEEEVEIAVDNMKALMEPVIMVVLGILIGGLVVAMYLPIFKMAANI